MFIFKKLTILLLLVCLYSPFVIAEPPLSPQAKRSLHALLKLDYEMGFHGYYIGEFLLNGSFYQDALIRFLQEAEGQEEFVLGMDYLEKNTHSFNSVCFYASTVLNFYTGDDYTPSPESVSITFNGKKTNAYFNTFKLGRVLSKEERKKLFDDEFDKYTRQGIVGTFVLDENTLETIADETVYNFVLLPNGTIVAALEQMGRREYHFEEEELINDEFKYPNHTILAGNPEQQVITAGAFIRYRVGDKRLYFISCKSGHFQPPYYTLTHMRDALAHLGVSPSTVISTPDVDISRVVLKTYKGGQVPILLTQDDRVRLFHQAKTRWEEVYQQIDRGILEKFALGDLSLLNAEIADTLSKQREEATYMRNAYSLFSCGHASPQVFHELVKRFGKLKDAIKHKVPARVQQEAKLVLGWLDHYEAFRAQEGEFVPGNDESFFLFMNKELDYMKALLKKERLLIDEYHDLKKISRELATLFMYMANDVKWKERGYFMYHMAAEAFFEINERMGQIHDAHVAKVMQGERSSAQEVYVTVSPKVIRPLESYMDHLGLAPPSFKIIIVQDQAWWLINWAKNWYHSHSVFLSDPQYHHGDRTIERETVFYLLQDILNDRVGEKVILEEIKKLKMLQRDAEAARNALIFLDASHAVPEVIPTYIDKLTHLIHGLERRDFACVKAEAAYFSDLDFPTNALEEWKCTDQESFDNLIEAYLNSIASLRGQKQLSRERAYEIAKRAQALQDLMDFIRRSGRRNKECTIPMVCFDLISQHAQILAEDLLEALEQGGEKIAVTPSMEQHAMFLRSKLSSREPINSSRQKLT